MYARLIWRKKTNQVNIRFHVFSILIVLLLLCTHDGYGEIYLDITEPSGRKLNIAIPDFKNLTPEGKHLKMGAGLPAVISNDLDLTGFFNSMDKAAFLEDKDAPMDQKDIRFKDWSVIGADLLLKGNYARIGNSLEVEIRLFDVDWARQILRKRALGDARRYRSLMHRLGNDIIKVLTDREGIFLSKIAFVGNATGYREIYVCDFDGQNVRQITKDDNMAILPSLSPDGKMITYTSYKHGGPMLYKRDLMSQKSRGISAREGLNIGASWSPDGTNLALTLSPRGNPDIYLIDLNGKIIKHLVRHWGIDTSPTFSPDGKKLAFVSDRSGSPQIYILDLKNNRADRLTFPSESDILDFPGRYNTSPSWSVNNRIAFSSLEGEEINIYTMDAAGGQLMKLTGGLGKNEDPCWSPDGQYIIFSSNRDGEYQLYMMNAYGQNQRKMVTQDGAQTSPSWAP